SPAQLDYEVGVLAESFFPVVCFSRKPLSNDAQFFFNGFSEWHKPCIKFITGLLAQRTPSAVANVFEMPCFPDSPQTLISGLDCIPPLFVIGERPPDIRQPPNGDIKSKPKGFGAIGTGERDGYPRMDDEGSQNAEGVPDPERPVAARFH